MVANDNSPTAFITLFFADTGFAPTEPELLSVLCTKPQRSSFDSTLVLFSVCWFDCQGTGTENCRECSDAHLCYGFALSFDANIQHRRASLLCFFELVVLSLNF